AEHRPIYAPRAHARDGATTTSRGASDEKSPDDVERHHDGQHALGRDMDCGACARRRRGVRQPHATHDPARQHRRQRATRAYLECVRYAPVRIGAACVGLRSAGPAIVPGSNRKITFGGEAGATIAVGALVVSDPVELTFAPLSDLAVSVHLPDDLPASFGITGRYARQTNYISPPGDFSAAEIMPVGRLTDDWYFVPCLDCVAPHETGAVVGLGDSLTDANISTHDGYHSWPSQLARRLMARQGGRPMAVMNQGLGGNRILHDIRGDSGLRRFDRDVL